MRNTNRYLPGLLAALLVLLLLAACDDSGFVPADGDDGDGPKVCDTDQDCDHCTVCTDGPGGRLCRELDCEENIDCADLGAGSYCQFGVCVCPSPEDGDQPDGEIPSDGAVLFTKPAVLNFGAVQMGDLQPLTLRACNGGKALLELNSVIIQQDNVRPEDREFTLLGSERMVPRSDNIIVLASGDCHELTVGYGPTNPGKDTGTLLLGSNVGIREVPLRSEEKGKPNMAADCDSLDPDFVMPTEEWRDACSFGFVPVQDTEVMTIRIINRRSDAADNAVLVINRIALLDPDNPDSAFIQHYDIDHDTIAYADNGREIWLAPDQEEAFSLVYSPQSAGVHFLEVLFWHNDENPDVPNPFVLRVLGAGVIPELAVNPMPLQFGNVEKGKCKTIEMELFNRGGATLNIHDVQINDTSGIMTQVFGLNLDPDADTQPNIPTSIEIGDEPTKVGVTCCPVGNEAYVNLLNIVSNDRAQTRWVTQVPMSCTGVEAFCDIWPVQLNFDGVQVGANSVKTVRIANNGRATARIVDMYIEGSLNFEFQFGVDLPADIPPGGLFELDIRYTPTSPGMDGGELVIHFRDGDCQQTTIPLVGNAVQPSISGPDDCLEWTSEQVPPSDLTPEQLRNWVTWKPVTIRNEGNDTLIVSEVFLPPAFAEWFMLDLPGGIGRAQIPPGGAWVFHVAYKPTSYGQYSGSVVVCSNASNSSGGGFSCSSGGNAHEICLLGSAIDPRLYVEPSTGRTTFSGVVVGEPPPPPQLVRLSNLGVGPVVIEKVRMGYGSPDITIVSIIHNQGGNQTNLTDNWPAEGVSLLYQTNTLDISVRCNPQSAGQHYRAMEITHSDRDMAKPGGVPGSEFPDYMFEVVCFSGNNAPPTAIVKSPAGVPPGPYGTRSISISKGEEIVLDGASSFDPDGNIVSYAWTASDPSKVSFTLPTNVSVTRARFDHIGTYTVTLRVADNYGSQSDTNYRDSQLVVTVYEAPRAIAYQCSTFLRSLRAETGTTVCFDGTSSRDQNNQAVAEYRWFMRKLGSSDFNFATSAQANYTFTEPGNYVVTLKVVDRFGNISVSPPTANATINVEAYADESLRIELTWTGRGNVSLHYIRPGGYLNDISDCNANNPRPNWVPHGYGNPEFIQSSANGVAPEVIVHENPGNGPPAYRVGAVYEAPTQDCGYVTECRRYNNNCDMCDCDCKPFCYILRICCQSCEKCEQKWKCADVPALLTFKFFVNNSPYPKAVRAGNEVVLRQRYDQYLFDIQRLNGEWFF